MKIIIDRKITVTETTVRIPENALIVVCAANLTGSYNCPQDCHKCFYGGDISITWNYDGRRYIQYYPNRTAVEADYKVLDQAHNDALDPSKEMPESFYMTSAEMAKLTALQDWLCTHDEQGEPVA